MGFLVVLMWVALIAVALAVIGFSQIFKLGEGIRLIWAGIICIGLALLLISGIEEQLVKAKIPSPSAEEQRETFIEEAIRDKPWMTREQFN